MDFFLKSGFPIGYRFRAAKIRKLTSRKNAVVVSGVKGYESRPGKPFQKVFSALFLKNDACGVAGNLPCPVISAKTIQ